MILPLKKACTGHIIKLPNTIKIQTTQTQNDNYITRTTS